MTKKKIIITTAALLTVVLAIWGTIGWVIIHFISKYW